MKLADFTDEQRAFIGGLMFEATMLERDRCAKLADDYARDGRTHKEYACETADELAARIRTSEG